jgi:hypothetical protein
LRTNATLCSTLAPRLFRCLQASCCLEQHPAPGCAYALKMMYNRNRSTTNAVLDRSEVCTPPLSA